jgi:hypothetical protein
MSAEPTPPLGSERTDIDPGDVLCDRHRKECFEVTSVDESGVALQRESTEFYIPHSLFAPWYGTRLHQIQDSTSTDSPDWTWDS